MPKYSKGQYGVTSTSGWISKAIQWVTHSEVNHAFVCVKDDGTCIEGDPHGARFTHASKYPHAIWSNFNLTEEEKDQIAAWAIATEGTPYGWLDCVAAGLDDLSQRYKWVPRFEWAAKRLGSLKTEDCSQLVSLAYTEAGIALCPNEEACQVSPGDLYNVILNYRGVFPEEIHRL